MGSSIVEIPVEANSSLMRGKVCEFVVKTTNGKGQNFRVGICNADVTCQVVLLHRIV